MSPELSAAISEGIEKAESAAQSEQWYQTLPDVLRTIAARQQQFFAGDIWKELDARKINTAHHRSALGGVIRRMEKRGQIRMAGDAYHRHNDGLTNNHARVMKWEFVG